MAVEVRLITVWKPWGDAHRTYSVGDRVDTEDRQTCQTLYRGTVIGVKLRGGRAPEYIVRIDWPKLADPIRCGYEAGFYASELRLVNLLELLAEAAS